MTNRIPRFRFRFRFCGIPETAKALMDSAPPPLRGQAEFGIGVFRICRTIPNLDKQAELGAKK
jgi:hypothetical protein